MLNISRAKRLGRLWEVGGGAPAKLGGPAREARKVLGGPGGGFGRPWFSESLEGFKKPWKAFRCLQGCFLRC